MVSRYHAYHNTAARIISSYKGEEPLSSFLRKFFAVDKRAGSSDRKHISHLCYCYYRLGKTAMTLSIGERITTGLFLCSEKPNEFLRHLRPEWNERTMLTTAEKEIFLSSTHDVKISHIFPWTDEISSRMSHRLFCESFLLQPDLFLRIRPGHRDMVINTLRRQGLDFTEPMEDCLALPNASRIDSILETDKTVVVQDMNSQKAGELLRSAFSRMHADHPQVWDCCAGSGGKSMLAYDINPSIQLTVSDIRKSILANLSRRFEMAGIRNYRSLVADLGSHSPAPGLNHESFDMIICDVPCTGSGTWARTPEQLYFFEKQEIEHYVSIQKKVLANVMPYLKRGGHLVYITCSVFREENEEVIKDVVEENEWQIMETQLFKGYESKADTLFAASMVRK